MQGLGECRSRGFSLDRPLFHLLALSLDKVLDLSKPSFLIYTEGMIIVTVVLGE